MAAPTKYNLKYFHIDVDMADDPKILLVEEMMGDRGDLVHSITIKLLSRIYGKEGYYMNWDINMAVVFSKRGFKNVDSQFIIDVVKGLILHKFFNQEMFDKYHILTSYGIQQRWKEVINSLKRKAAIKQKYYIASSSNEFIPEETTAEAEFNTAESELIRQSKVKESKRNITYLRKDDDSSGGKENPTQENFAAAPEVNPDNAGQDTEKPMSLDDCIIYYFTSPDFSEHKYLACTSRSMYKTGTSSVDTDCLYAWALCFNRWRKKQRDRSKTYTNWSQHFVSWLSKQNLSLNPNSLNVIENEKRIGNTIGDTSGQKATDFYHRPVQIRRSGESPETGTRDSKSPV